MTRSERLARLEACESEDPRTIRDLQVIRSQIERLEGRLFRIAKSRSNWTRLGALQLIVDEQQET